MNSSILLAQYQLRYYQDFNKKFSKFSI
jgi:hypothetical protein